MSQAIAEQVRITYRQLDHWTRLGFLKPLQLNKEHEPVEGSGHVRSWPASELEVARAMGDLVRAGLIPAAAHRVAREARTALVLEALGARS